eukprot:UN07375
MALPRYLIHQNQWEYMYWGVDDLRYLHTRKTTVWRIVDRGGPNHEFLGRHTFADESICVDRVGGFGIIVETQVNLAHIKINQLIRNFDGELCYFSFGCN